MPYSFFTTIPYELDENETEIEVFYDYHPEEKRTRDYPGCAEEADVYEIMPNDEGGEIPDAAYDAMLDRKGKYFSELCTAALASHTEAVEGERESAADLEFERKRERYLHGRPVEAYDPFAEDACVDPVGDVDVLAEMVPA